jgi:hypothetical protein
MFLAGVQLSKKGRRDEKFHAAAQARHVAPSNRSSGKEAGLGQYRPQRRDVGQVAKVGHPRLQSTATAKFRGLLSALTGAKRASHEIGWHTVRNRRKCVW